MWITPTHNRIITFLPELCIILVPEDTEAIVTEKRNWLKYNAEPRHMVKAYMVDTRQARIHWIHGDDQPSIADILEAYPRYADPGAYVWVSYTYMLCSLSI